MDLSRELHYYSITVTLSNAHVPMAYFNNYKHFLNDVVYTTGGVGFCARETGPVKKQLHLQSAVQLRTSSANATAEVSNFLKENVVPWMAGRKVTVKPFGRQQTILRMAGYCMKDDGKAHYRFHSVGISREDLAKAKEAYEVVRVNFFDGKTVLKKYTVVAHMWQQWKHFIRPLDVNDPATIVMWMIQSGEFMFDQEWMCRSGAGVLPSKLSALWKIARYPGRTTLDDVKYIMHDMTTR